MMGYADITFLDIFFDLRDHAGPVHCFLNSPHTPFPIPMCVACAVVARPPCDLWFGAKGLSARMS